MDNFSPEEIGRLRKIFSEMNNSRRQLHPILAEMTDSIEKGVFIEADSEEVSQLLEQIINAQEEFFDTEPLRASAISKKLELVDKSLNKLEQNCQFNQINAVLDRIATLIVDSEAPATVDAVNKIKQQAENLKLKSGKVEAMHFARLAEKFVILTEIIDNADETESLSEEDFLRVFNNFQETPLITRAVMKNLLHFEKPDELEPPEEVQPESESVTIDSSPPVENLPPRASARFNSRAD